MKELISITEVSLKINEEKNLKELLLYALKIAKETFGFENGEIFITKQGIIVNKPIAIYGSNVSEKPNSEHIQRAIDTKQTIVDNSKPISVLSTPIISAKKVIGVLNFQRNNGEPFIETDIKNAEALSAIISISTIHVELNKDIKEKLKKLHLLYEIGQELSKTLELEKLLEVIINLIKDTFHFDNVAVLLKSDNGKFLRLNKASRGYTKEKIKTLKINIKKGEGLTGTAAKSGETIMSNDVENDKRYINASKRTKSEIAIPLKTKGQLLGVLDVENNIKNSFSEEDRKVLEAIAIEVALAIDNALLYEKMKKLAEKDELTGLYNYRSFRKELNKEILRAQRYNKKFSLAMFDTDFFKEYNDNNGHDTGNVALQKVGEILIKECRNLDFPTRFGGEEFVVILPETSKKGSLTFAERVRKIIEETKFIGEEKQPNGKLTISGGVAEFPIDGNTAEKIIKSVDIAAYKAKNSGRNRIEAFNNDKKTC